MHNFFDHRNKEHVRKNLFITFTEDVRVTQGLRFNLPIRLICSHTLCEHFGYTNVKMVFMVKNCRHCEKVVVLFFGLS